MKRVLIINTSRLGDIVMSTPVFQYFKEKGFGVDLFHLPSFGAILPYLPDIDDHIEFPFNTIVPQVIAFKENFASAYRGIDEVMKRILKKEYDLVVNLSIAPWVAIIAYLCGGKRTLGFTVDRCGRREIWGSWGVYNAQSGLSRPLNRFHWVDIYRWLVGSSQRYPYRLKIPPHKEEEASGILFPAPYWVGVIPSASLPEKRMGWEFWAKVLQPLYSHPEVNLVFFGSEEDRKVTDRLQHFFPRALNLAGKIDLGLLAAILSRCRLVLTHDTGPMHIAVAMGVPVIVVNVGSAFPFETAPYQEGSIVISPDHSCFPCGPGEKCGYYACQDKIAPQLVSGWAEHLLLGTSPPPPDPKVKVYRTDWGAWSELLLIPLGSPLLTWEEFLAQALREVWATSVPPTPNTLGINSQRMKSFQNFLSQYFHINPISWDSHWNHFSQGALKIIHLARQGKKIAREVARLASSRSSPHRLLPLSEQLRELDRQLVLRAHQYLDLYPLVSFFTFSKESLVGDKVELLARSTQHFYFTLILQTRSLLQVIKDTLQSWDAFHISIPKEEEKSLWTPVLP